MRQRMYDTTQFRKPTHAPDKRIAWVRTAPDIVQQFMAMIRPKNDIITLPGLFAAALLIKKYADQRDHICVTGQMRGFLEGTICLLFYISQMSKVNPIGKLTGYLRHVIVRMRAK